MKTVEVSLLDFAYWVGGYDPEPTDDPRAIKLADKLLARVSEDGRFYLEHDAPYWVGDRVSIVGRPGARVRLWDRGVIRDVQADPDGWLFVVDVTEPGERGRSTIDLREAELKPLAEATSAPSPGPEESSIDK